MRYVNNLNTAAQRQKAVVITARWVPARADRLVQGLGVLGLLLALLLIMGRGAGSG